MQVRSTLLRIIKFLGKAILGLFLVLLIMVGLIHLPPIQKQITRSLANYLSSKLEARVDVKRITFSLLGNVIIEDLAVSDPHDKKVFSAGKIEATSNIVDLITGDLIFDEVRLSGVDWKLIQKEEGLNIQFILDAFQSKDNQSTTQSPSINLQFNKILLENFVFEFTSSVSGTTVMVTLGTFTGQEAELTTNPLKIKADQFIIEHSVVNTLTIHHPDSSTTLTSTNNEFLSPDFGIGIIFEIRDLQLKDDEFSFHRDQVITTQKFDPSHITVKNIQLSLSDILMREDTLGTVLQSLSAQLPGFTVADARGGVQLNHNQVILSGLHLASGTNELNADFTGGYDSKSANNMDSAQAKIASQCRINPEDLAYFFSDSVMNLFTHWGPTELTVDGNYSQGKGEIKTLKLITKNSQLHSEGMVNEVFDLVKLNWKDLIINASIGSDFKRIFTPFIRTTKIPPDVTLQLTSSGNPHEIYLDGKVITTWGDVKATGLVTQQSGNIGLDLNLTGEQVDLGEWMNQSSLGHMDLAVVAKGIIGDNTNIDINGLINEIEMLDQTIHHIAFQSNTIETNATVTISIEDPKFASEINSEVSFAGPLMFTSAIQFDDFSLGRLLHRDSTLSISGRTKSKIIIDQSSFEGYVEGDSILLQNKITKYVLDTLAFHVAISPTASDISYYTDYAIANLTSNFDIRDSREVFQTWSGNLLKVSSHGIPNTGTRAVNFDVELDDANLFQLLGIDVDDFSSLKVTGAFDEQRQTSMLHTTSGKFEGYGISFDTLHTQLMATQESVSASMNATNLFYNSVQLGNLDVDLLKKGDTTLSNLLLSSDSITLVGLRSRILPTDSGAFIYTDKLVAFDHDYVIDPENSVYIENKNIVLNHLVISRDSMQIDLDGDLNAFEVSLRNVDLTPLNYLISPDTTVINQGYITGKASYSRDHQLNIKADIDRLSLYNSNPLTIAATAVSEGNQVPFQFLLTNTSNKIDLQGDYFLDTNQVDATVLLDVHNLELFSFLVAGVIDEMNGTLKGEATITGPIQKPAFKGQLQFLDVGLTTANPKLTFNVEDNIITLDNGLLFKDFTIYDQEQHPLTINGNLSTEDYQSFAYDLQINAKEYYLINKPDSSSGRLRGSLVIDSDIKLKGNEKDTHVEAKLTIKDATKLTFVTSSDDIELLKTEGIIDFIDPTLLLDSLMTVQSTDLYDSLIASLPDFNLNSRITIQDNASIRIVIDEQSGDYLETAGGATLDLGYDRTGNLNLSGNYIIKKGVYRLSFYDLVKKNFTLVPGSSINWSGNPENGDLNIKAVHTVESNSIGLIGHEVGENEKSIYKRSLNYEVGININGTIEKPIISFSLDLPQNEKVSYPVLANKLDRLRQPEYESELNKQVFGLLVLGGFLPESSGSDINSSLIATTALSNSVNSLLASQLNRFASQYIKGVNIDVGIQSYSDYSAPGGKTQTAMDFRVSKSILDDRLSFEIGGDFDINQDQSGANTGTKNYRGDIAIIYDLTGNGDKQLKLFNNETYDIIYQEIRNTGISLIFIREFENKEKHKNKDK